MKLIRMATLSTEQCIKSLTHQAEHLNVIFNNSWYQDDIGLLVELLFIPITNVTMQEVIIGADRENHRFIWHESYFVLNFDCYSQSCWIEGQDQASKAQLANFHSSITATDNE